MLGAELPNSMPSPRPAKAFLRSLLRRSGTQPRLVRAVSTRVKRVSSSADMLPSSVGDGGVLDGGVVDGEPVGDWGEVGSWGPGDLRVELSLGGTVGGFVGRLDGAAVGLAVGRRRGRAADRDRRSGGRRLADTDRVACRPRSLIGPSPTPGTACLTLHTVSGI